jgi:MSHA biogenesis protein MshO
MSSRGFTLVELVMVIVITGIIAATGVVFFKPVVDSYFAAQRRATLTDLADTALRRMGREIHTAVPNSIRWPNNQCIEMVPTSTGGRYRMASDTINDTPTPLPCTPSATCSAPLDITQPVTQFDVLSPMSVTPSANDWVVIDNQNVNDVYTAGTNRAAISGTSTVSLKDSNGIATNVTRISISSTQFPSGYTGGRFTVVPNNGGNPSVVYVCSGTGIDTSGNGTGTLYRVTRAFNATYPASCPSTAGGSILVTNVQTCNLVYNASQDGTQQSALVWMQLQITQSNESITADYGVHVDNVP